MTTHLYLASILHFPQKTAQPKVDFSYIKDGALVTQNGKILATGQANDLLSQYPEAVSHDYRDQIIMPGFIDSHLHFPQTEMLASFGEQLLDWLDNYTFPTEKKFANPEYAAKIADIFLRQLYRNGTTSAMVYSSVHQCAADALFKAAKQHKMLMIAGKVCMDRHCPSWLQDTPETAQKESAELIERWHGKDRLYYAITPRFAPTSSHEQLHALGELAQQYPDVYIQSHLNENLNEIDWVNSLFPNYNGYLDVYDKFNMLRPKAMFGHCIHMQEHEWQRMSDSGASIAFCPTSNLFLGSGLFDLKTAEKYDIPVALATDVGAGTTFSMLRTLGEAYKVGQLRSEQLPPLHGLYLMTQGAAVAQGLEQSIGNLNAGTDADFVIVDPHFDELTSLRCEQQNEIQDIIFALSMLADDRAITATYIAGEPVYRANT
ncbi:guanine deaminase [Paraglaciecola sp. T6c]|uniref:guanine deaminase n=1 Tax=Pseudoalteromonas atlantica (strain T6c / ATCC BAA-1087) TaxID=3042615 RepID=UPI00005C6999|nr:guanine deaminase [Paraglaciecola sp. T6c]ABG40945.1 guanine deaminase [Paraglaciecola sp. T6c]